MEKRERIGREGGQREAVAGAESRESGVGGGRGAGLRQGRLAHTDTLTLLLLLPL